jgi:acetate kinase
VRAAIALFVYRIVRELGSLIAALGGIDALVFSAGIGEHDALTRAEVVEGSRWTGANGSLRAIPRRSCDESNDGAGPSSRAHSSSAE